MNKQYRLKNTDGEWRDFYIGDVSRYDIRDRVTDEPVSVNKVSIDRIRDILEQINEHLEVLQSEIRRLK